MRFRKRKAAKMSAFEDTESLRTGDESDDVYNELRGEIGMFVDAAIIDTEIENDVGGM